MNNDIIIYAKYDENNSIIRIISSCILNDTEGYEEIDRWVEGEDGYLYAHADNGKYVLQKYGKPLFDENGIPNFKKGFVELTDEEKQTLYPQPEPQPSELEVLKQKQELTEQALQDLILMMLGGE